MATSLSAAGITFPNGTVQARPLHANTVSRSESTAGIAIPASGATGTHMVIIAGKSGDVGVGNLTGTMYADNVLYPYSYDQLYCCVTSQELNNVTRDTGGIGTSSYLDHSNLQLSTDAVLRMTVLSASNYWLVNYIIIGSALSTASGTLKLNASGVEYNSGTAAAVTHVGPGSYSHATTGWELVGDFLIQWGYVAGTTSTLTINFPRAWTDLDNYSLMLTPASSSTDTGGLTVTDAFDASDRATTSCIVSHYTTSSPGVYWIAMGKA